MIADTMQNLALLLWAHRETGIADFQHVALTHARTTATGSFGEPQHLDSSASAIMAAGLYILAGGCEEESPHCWRNFADRLLEGLLSQRDLTATQGAQGFLVHGSAHVPAGRYDSMLHYDDNYSWKR
jgi:hypothetical protein